MMEIQSSTSVQTVCTVDLSVSIASRPIGKSVIATLS